MSPPDPEELSKGDNACKEEKCYKKYTTNKRQRWDDFEKKIIQKVQRVLPQWLTEPDVIQRDITSNLVPISDVPGICTRLQRKLEGNGIQHLFPVHVEVIPVILENVSWSVDWKRGYKPRNICVSAPTGSGKTGIRYTCYSGTDGARFM